MSEVIRDGAGRGREVRLSELPVQVVRRFTDLRCHRPAHRIVEAVSISGGCEDRFDWIIGWLLVVLLAVMPLAFGAVEAWSEEIVIALAAAISICFLLKVIVVRTPPLLWTWAYVPVAGLLVLVAVQLIPLPGEFVRLLSPHTAAQKTSLWSELTGAEAFLPTMTISFYPNSTRHDLRLLLCVAAVFGVVVNVFRSPGQIMRLLLAVTIIGAGVAALALAQDILGNDRIYWFGPMPGGPARSGPFINHSHYAQFMSLSIGATLALICVKIHQEFAQRPVTPAVVAECLGSPAARAVWALAAMAVVGAATVFISLSRGGMISMITAGAFTAFMVSLRKPLRGSGWIMALLALGAFVCVLYVGFDAVYDRLGAIGGLHEAVGGRWQIVKDIAVAWTRFPAVGTGLGTHQVVYPMFDRSMEPSLAAYAENEYAQAAEEMGACGLAALVIFGILVWRSYARTIWSAQIPAQSAAYGLGFGLAAILVHSLSDFGQHLPANAVLSAVFCALLLRLPHIGAEDGASGAWSDAAGVHSRWGRIAMLAAMCIVWAWALLDAEAARRAETYWASVLPAERNLMGKNWQSSDEEYVSLLSDAATARQYQPGNIEYRHWLNVYRWRAISRASDPNTEQIILTPQGLEFAERIAAELKDALKLCPTFGPSWCVLGQLERSVLGRVEEGTMHVRRGRQLAPCDPTVCFVAGTLCAEQGQTEAAFAEWQRAVQLDERFFGEVASLLIKRLGRPDLSYKLAVDRPSRLIALESALDVTGDSSGLLTRVRDRIAELLEADCQTNDAAAWEFAWLARRYRQQGGVDQAIRMYRRAIALEYGQIEWRLALAELLIKRGRTPEAVRELNTVLRLRPQSDEARSLLEGIATKENAGLNTL
jgi:tetratricopeptide (TPR) repeat protein